MKKIEYLIEKMELLKTDDDFDYKMYDELDLVKIEDVDILDIELILRFMEDNQDIDFGSPGSLVHFLEKYYQKGYEKLLVESIKRTPTLHTLWMLNRIINGEEEKKRSEYLELLKIVSQAEIDYKIRASAKEYFDFQLNP